MNTGRSAIESLLTRTSLAGSFMKAPAPDDAELKLILGAAQRAADHGRIRPWRFIVVRPAQYEAFYDRLAEAATRVQGDPSRYDMNREKYRLTARAPLLVVAAAKIDPAHKVAPIEQTFAAAGATQLVLNAAHALGYSAFLFSGAGVFDEPFKASLGLAAQDHLIGFICLGTANGPGKPGPSAQQSIEEGLAATVREWSP
ncbi:MAG: nitroreductase [Proteobacteria bacterium]|jgi:nitroreductase|nr:nitroreductase [Pseudomonadota bacterium]MBK7117270.1 nitroreductase [Pseudomonadota bacterium]MCC6630870.1 nitroreductase [Gammaproteobacteria bacterium]